MQRETSSKASGDSQRYFSWAMRSAARIAERRSGYFAISAWMASYSVSTAISGRSLP